MEYKYPENVDYITGLGAGTDYELDCQKAVIAGMNWIKDNPMANIGFNQTAPLPLIEVIGQDSERFKKVIYENLPRPTGGRLMWLVIIHCAHAHKNGWDNYLRDLKEIQNKTI
jgi:hypothetical protein